MPLFFSSATPPVCRGQRGLPACLPAGVGEDYINIKPASRLSIISPAIKDCIVVIVRLDRTIQNLLKYLDSPIKSWNDEAESFMYLFAGPINTLYQNILLSRLKTWPVI